MGRTGTLSFRTRLTVRWTAVFGCVLAAASVLIYVGIRTQSYVDLDRHLRTLAGTEVASAFDRPISPHVHDLPTTALTGGTFTEKLVQVFDASGRLVVASDGRGQDAQVVDPELIAAAFSGDAPVTTVDVDGVPIRVVVLHTVHDGTAYAFAVGVVITDFLASLNRVKGLLIAVWVVGLLATAAVGFALASTALLPVRHITQRAMDIARANLDARLETPVVDDEIGAMARSLNTLLERLHAALDVNRRFAADAAHELRSPITAMAGEIDVALRRDRTTAEYQETLRLVRDRLSALSSVISDLMLLVRSQEGRDIVKRQELALESLVGSSIARLRSVALSRGVTISTGDLGGLSTYGEPGLLGRVFDNVLENAIRYNREHGTVSITGSFTDSAAGSWEAGRIVVRVTDSGPGIPDGETDRVFDRFYRVDTSRTRHTGGAGLGLAIAREVLALFHGTIRVEHTSAQGTSIAIDLPGSAEADTSSAPATRAVPGTAAAAAS